jgi:two-component sensor histidine kinase
MTGATRADQAWPFDAIDGRFRKALTRLAVEAWRSSDAQLRRELSSLADRIRSVVDRYEQHRNSGVRSVDPADYLERLRTGLLAESGAGGRISLAIVTDVRALSIEGALVIGLIVSELVATASARVGPSSPRRVTVQVGRVLSGYVVTVTNQRRTWRQAVLPDPEAIGMVLVRQLVRDLQGTFKVVNRGADVEIGFSLGEGDLLSPLRNISPRGTLDRDRAPPSSAREGRHELRYS